MTDDFSLFIEWCADPQTALLGTVAFGVLVYSVLIVGQIIVKVLRAAGKDV